MNRTPRIVDACCTLNLLATGREVEILEALGLVVLLPERVRPEVRFLSTPPDNDNLRHRESTTIDHLVDMGLIQVKKLDTEPLVDAFINAAAQICDTDASCIALAGVLNAPLVSDDGKERRVARSLFPNLKLVSTLEIVHDAAVALGWDEPTLVRVAVSLRWRGNFAAPRRDQWADWYNALLKLGGVGSP